MSNGQNYPLVEDTSSRQFRVPPVPLEQAANWLRAAAYHIDNNRPGSTTTTTRHFAAWEQTTTTHFRGNGGHHQHPLLAASASLSSPPGGPIRPIPNRLLASPPTTMIGYDPPKPVKIEARQDIDTDGTDSAFEDWEGCSRTTPVNHKSLRKWRQHSQPGGGYSSSSKKSSLTSSLTPTSSFQPISIMTSSPLDSNGGGPLSAPSAIHSWQRPGSVGSSGGSSFLGGPFSPSDSLFTSPSASSSGLINDCSDSSMIVKHRRPKSETVTSPDSLNSSSSGGEDSKATIPIGIAVGRQRSAASEALLNISSDNSKSDDSGLELKRPLPPPPPPRPLPPTSSEPPGPPPLTPLDYMLRPPPAHLWPLPYMAQAQPSIGGYQLAKDPLTGQMFFVPGFNHHLAAAASLWPSAAPLAAAPASPFATVTPFQQSLMQLQQESWMARQGFVFNQPQQQHEQPLWRPPSPPRPSRHTDTNCKAEPASISELNNGKSTPNGAITDGEDQVSVGDPNDELKVNSSTAFNVKTEVKSESKTVEVSDGLHLLTQGIDRLEKLEQKTSNSRLGLLCDAAFLSDDEHHHRSSSSDLGAAEAVKAVTRSKSLDFVRSPRSKQERTLSSDYRSPKAERNAKAYIASKSLKVSEELETTEAVANGLDGGGRSRIDDWERNVRVNLADIQKKYREKYKELYKLQHSNKSKKSSPAKKEHSNNNIKPHHHNHHHGTPAKKTLAPVNPWFKTFKVKPPQVERPQSTNGQVNPESAVAVLKDQEPSHGPDLSSITSKFRSVRPNPFENLLKLSCVGKKTNEGVKKTEEVIITEDHQDRVKEEPLMVSTTVVDLPQYSSTPKPTIMVTKKAPMEAFLLKEDLKPDTIPKLHLANDHHNDADVSDEEDEDPPVLEPMLEQQPNNIALTVKIKRPSSVSPSRSLSPASSASKAKKSKKKAKKAKKEKREREREHHHHHRKHHKKTVVHLDDDDDAPEVDLVKQPQPKTGNDHQVVAKKIKKCPKKEAFIQGPESCLIKENDLVEGLRVLIKLDGHFHPGKIQAISPPDIYGVLVDKERGNKPHIFSREEVLKEAIFEVKPASVNSLRVGARVCAYWSQKYNHLYPGTVSDMDIDPKLDSNYVNVELDDGDNRDIHVNSIRFLPPRYPQVVYDPDPVATMGRRKRRQSWESGTSDGSRATKTPRASFDDMSEPPTPKKIHHLSGDLKMRINVGGQTNNIKQRKLSENGGGQSKVVRKAALAQRPSISSSSDSEDGKGGIASFLPKDQVWKWADKGQKRAKGRTYHKVIERKDEQLSNGDSAVFLSTNCPDQPYIGRIESMWETASGTKNVGVRWFYHLAEVECSSPSDRRKLDSLKQPKGALFESNHYDENDVQTISQRCDVLPYESFVVASKEAVDIKVKAGVEDESNDKYYLAGNHNAIEKTVQLSPGVLSSNNCDL